MCETIKPSSWDQGGILRDIFTITRTIDNAVDSVFDSPAKFWYHWYMNKDIVNLAISMTEIDTGITLSLKERKEMVESILTKIKNIKWLNFLW